MSATMFGSLIVHAMPIASPSASPTVAAYAPRRAGMSGDSKPPRAAIQRGSVKWCSVTTGTRPRSRQPSATRR